MGCYCGKMQKISPTCSLDSVKILSDVFNPLIPYPVFGLFLLCNFFLAEEALVVNECFCIVQDTCFTILLLMMYTYKLAEERMALAYIRCEKLLALQ